MIFLWVLKRLYFWSSWLFKQVTYDQNTFKNALKIKFQLINKLPVVTAMLNNSGYGNQMYAEILAIWTSLGSVGDHANMRILVGQILRLESGFEACKSLARLASLLMLFQFNNVSLVNSFIDVIKINLIYHKSNYE